jgi:hypothetical protein
MAAKMPVGTPITDGKDHPGDGQHEGEGELGDDLLKHRSAGAE